MLVRGATPSLPKRLQSQPYSAGPETDELGSKVFGLANLREMTAVQPTAKGSSTAHVPVAKIISLLMKKLKLNKILFLDLRAEVVRKELTYSK